MTAMLDVWRVICDVLEGSRKAAQNVHVISTTFIRSAIELSSQHELSCNLKAWWFVPLILQLNVLKDISLITQIKRLL